MKYWWEGKTLEQMPKKIIRPTGLLMEVVHWEKTERSWLAIGYMTRSMDRLISVEMYEDFYTPID
jgi:hypothetical protein